MKCRCPSLWGLLGMLCLGLSACPKQYSGSAADAGGSHQKYVIEERDPDMLYQQATQAAALGRYPMSLAYLNRFAELHPKHDLYSKVLSLREEIRQRLGSRQIRIGVLLPLTGSQSRFGDSVWLGMECAFGLLEPCSYSGQDYRLVVRDVSGTPEAAAQAVLELAQKEKVALILGPLLSVHAEAAARQAQALGIPLVSLAPKADVSKTGDFVFQHSLTAQQEIQTLGKYLKTVPQQGVAIVYPKNRYGEEYQALFAAEAEQAGKKIVARLGYPPNESNFVEVLRGIKMKGELFEILFVPDAYSNATRIAEALEWIEIPKVLLLGTSRWNHPNLLAANPEMLEGSVFVAGFNAISPREEVQTFTSEFSRALGHQPGWLEAIGYDAARLASASLQIQNNNHWPDVQRGLLSLESQPGVMGTFSWNDERASQWSLDLLTVREGQIQLLQTTTEKGSDE